MPELDRLPRGLLLLACAVGAIGIVGAALLAGEEDFLSRLGAKGFELVATLAFGFAGLSEVALHLRKRIHRRRTQDLAVLTLERMESELSSLAQQVFGILAHATPEAGKRTSLDIGPAFRVPIEETQRAYWQDAIDRIATQCDAFELAAEPVANCLEELSKAQYDEQIRAAKEKIELLAREPRGDGDTSPMPAPSMAQVPGEIEPISDGDTGQESLESRYEDFIDFKTEKPDPVLDIACFAEGADAQLPAIQEQWSALAEVSTQMASLLAGEEARPLLERNLELRARLSTYNPLQRPTDLSEDPDQRTLQIQLWRIGRGNDAYGMVLNSLLGAWAMLEALDDVFRSRVGHCDGAHRHLETKQTLDAMATLARQQHTVKQRIEKIRDRTERQRQQIQALTT